MLNNFASCSKTNFKSLLVTADFIVNNRGARELQDLSPISPSRKSSRPPARRSFNTVTRLHKIFRSAAHIRVRDPNFPRYPAVDTKEEDSRRKISLPSPPAVEKTRLRVMYDLSPLPLADLLSSATFITHFRSHLATFKIPPSLLASRGGGRVGEGSFCRFQ